jgi:hypothetical protein
MALPALVLVHGGGLAADSWELAIEEIHHLAPELTVLAPDLPGRRYNPGDLGVGNCCRLGVFECTSVWSSSGLSYSEDKLAAQLNPRDWPGYASCGPVGTTAPFVSSSSGSAGDGGPDQRIPLAWRACVRPTRVTRWPWAVKPEPKPRKGDPHERVTKTHSAATVGAGFVIT